MLLPVYVHYCYTLTLQAQQCEHGMMRENHSRTLQTDITGLQFIRLQVLFEKLRVPRYTTLGDSLRDECPTNS